MIWSGLNRMDGRFAFILGVEYKTFQDYLANESLAFDYRINADNAERIIAYCKEQKRSAVVSERDGKYVWLRVLSVPRFRTFYPLEVEPF